MYVPEGNEAQAFLVIVSYQLSAAENAAGAAKLVNCGRNILVPCSGWQSPQCSPEGGGVDSSCHVDKERPKYKAAHVVSVKQTHAAVSWVLIKYNEARAIFAFWQKAWLFNNGSLSVCSFVCVSAVTSLVATFVTHRFQPARRLQKWARFVQLLTFVSPQPIR